MPKTSEYNACHYLMAGGSPTGTLFTDMCFRATAGRDSKSASAKDNQNTPTVSSGMFPFQNSSPHTKHLPLNSLHYVVISTIPGREQSCKMKNIQTLYKISCDFPGKKVEARKVGRKRTKTRKKNGETADSEATPAKVSHYSELEKSKGLLPSKLETSKCTSLSHNQTNKQRKPHKKKKERGKGE